MKSNIEIVREIYQYFASANFEAVKNLFDKNILWEQMDGFLSGGKIQRSC